MTIKDYYSGVEHNFIGSETNSTGTRDSDFFGIEGNYVTIHAYDGADTIHFWSGGYNSALVFAGGGADEIGAAEYNTIYGEGGNDTIEIGSHSYIDGGAGDDVFEIGYSNDVTLTGGAGNDNFKFSSSTMIITDLENGDILRNTASNSKPEYLTYTKENGNIVLKDEDPTSFQITLQGVTDISQVANAEYRTENGAIKLGSLVASNPVLTSQQTTVPATNTTDTTPAGGNTTIINNTTINNTTNNNYFGFPLASNMFGFFGGQSNTISKFVTGRGSNANVLAFGTSLTSINRTSSYMSFNAADGTKLQVNNSSSVNEAIQYTTDGKNISLAKVGYAEENNSFTYEDGVNFYSGGSHTDVLNVTNYQSRNIWLDGSAGVGYSGINNIDASTSTGNNTLAGDSGNNQITAGSGNDSLWGGSGSSEDVLIGGSGQNMFWYGKGDGNDQVQKSKTQDTINLYDVTLADIVSANFTGNAISATFNTGFNLNVNVSSNLSSTFRLADGTNWKYNKSAGNWQSA